MASKEWLIRNVFYNALNTLSNNMFDIVAGETIMGKQATQAYELPDDM